MGRRIATDHDMGAIIDPGANHGVIPRTAASTRLLGSLVDDNFDSGIGRRERTGQAGQTGADHMQGHAALETSGE